MSESGNPGKFQKVPLEQITHLIEGESVPVKSGTLALAARTHAARLLLVDVDITLGNLRAKVLEISGFHVSLALSIGSAVQRIKVLPPHILVFTSSISDRDSEMLVEVCRRHSPATHIALLLTGDLNVKRAERIDSFLDSSSPHSMVAALRGIASALRSGNYFGQ
jgi:hypothetical protein